MILYDVYTTSIDESPTIDEFIREYMNILNDANANDQYGLISPSDYELPGNSVSTKEEAEPFTIEDKIPTMIDWDENLGDATSELFLLNAKEMV
jgi:hypothetical protein